VVGAAGSELVMGGKSKSIIDTLTFDAVRGLCMYVPGFRSGLLHVMCIFEVSPFENGQHEMVVCFVLMR
jgi:hypothetical protein